MSWEPTPDQKARVRWAHPDLYALHTDVIATGLRAFLPEGTVPVFLTPQEIDALQEAVAAYKVPHSPFVILTAQDLARVKLDAALKEAEGK